MGTVATPTTMVQIVGTAKRPIITPVLMQIIIRIMAMSIIMELIMDIMIAGDLIIDTSLNSLDLPNS